MEPRPKLVVTVH